MKDLSGTSRIDPAFAISPLMNESAEVEVAAGGACTTAALLALEEDVSVSGAETTASARDTRSMDIDGASQSFGAFRTRSTWFERRVASFVRAPCFDSIPKRQSLQRNSLPSGILTSVIPDRPQ